MAKILYGVTGQGSGHSSRSKEIISHLISSGHKIKILSYDKGYDNLSPFFEVEKIFGLNFVYEDNEVKYVRTLFNNLLKTNQAQQSIRKALKIIAEFQPEIVITDFEPISSLCANIKKLPLISIDNQHRITNAKIEYPKEYKKHYLAAKAVTKLMVFNADAYLILSFLDLEITKPKSFVFPPVLRKEIFELNTCCKEFVLVYLTSEYDDILNVLHKINKNFVVYGLNKAEQQGNILLKKFDGSGFLNDLSTCQAVIANSGFTLISESLYLQKPYLGLPVKAQFEQIINAYELQKMGYGKYSENLDVNLINEFLQNLDFYNSNLKNYQKQDNSKIFTKIDELIKNFT